MADGWKMCVYTVVCLLDKAIFLAQEEIKIKTNKIKIIKHSQKSLLFDNDYVWRKKRKDL